MDFELNENQTLLRDTAREFAQKRVAPLAFDMDEKAEMPSDLLKEAAELGYFGLLIPEQYGGLGLDMVSYVAALEEIARASAGLMITISVHNSLVAQGLLQFGSDALQQKYLPKLATGELIGAYALTEPGAGTDAASLVTSALRQESHFLVNGTKSWVTNAGLAGLFCVFVSTNLVLKSKGISCLLVERGTAGLSLGAQEKKMGIKCSDTREISFQDAKVPVANLLGTENDGYKVALALLDFGRLGVGAQAVGIARAALDEAVKYAKERQQFGQPIANFQGIQFKLADMATQIEAARLLVYRAAALKDTPGRWSKEIAMAKLFASEAVNFVANEAVQIHGGYGYIKEYPVERYFRDARVTEIYEGTSEVQRMVISRALLA